MGAALMQAKGLRPGAPDGGGSKKKTVTKKKKDTCKGKC
jgi:hypothetical protein